MHRKIKDANSGMERIIGYCKTKYLRKLRNRKKRGNNTQKKKFVQMAKSITDLEKTAQVAMKANEAFAQKAPKVLEQTSSENTDSVGKVVGETIAKTIDTVSKTFVTPDEEPVPKPTEGSVLNTTEGSVPKPTEGGPVPNPTEGGPVPNPTEGGPEPIKVEMKNGGK
jgi:hypothetical protein